MCRLALALLLLPVLACDSSKPDAEAETKPQAEIKPAETKPAETKPAEPAPLSPAPPGAIAIDRLYVQTCAEPEACPSLLQDAGAAHCKALTLGELTWRLPTIAELEQWRGHESLVGFDVFHWSGSAWDEDPAQFWMYDPGSGSKTTAKPDRKPFTIRCVAQP